MKINAKNIIRFFFITVFILFLLVDLHAQSKKTKQRWNWQKHKTETINYAKKYMVSNIEPNLPHQNFAQWFRSLVGKKAKVVWEINDCGEQNGTRPGKSKILPMCAEVNAEIGTDVWVGIFFQYGTLKGGIMSGKPIIRHIYIGREDDPTISPENLVDLSAKLSGIIAG